MFLFFVSSCQESNAQNKANKLVTEKAPLVAPKKAPSKAQVGALAPNFVLPSMDGVNVELKKFRGKVVVLEWFNPGCPFVKQVHGPGGVLENFSNNETKKGTVWLAINSGAPGNQGHGIEQNKDAAAKWQLGHPILMDEKGVVGKIYGARTTPQMYVIDKEGVLVYQGAPDNAPYGEPKEGQRVAFLKEVLGDLHASKKLRHTNTKPWGCSVKY